MPFPVFIKGREGGYLACNSLFLEFIGLTEDQVIGHDTAEIVSAELFQSHRDQDAVLWAEGTPLVYDSQVRPFGGELRDVRLHKSLFRDETGRVLGIIGVLHDVTEERSAARALAESESRFARLAELTREGVVLHSHGAILDVNDAFCQMTGWSRGDIVGQDYSVLICPEFIDAAEARVRGRSAAFYRIMMRRCDGGTFPAEVQGRSTTYDGQEIRVTTLIDISTRLEAEQAMLEREQLYRQMFETNVAVKLLIDPSNGQIVDANKAAERFYGWPLDKLRLMNITEINVLLPGQVQREMALAYSEDRLFFRFTHRTASGEQRLVEVYSGPVTFHNRALLHSIIYDVTDRERALKELELKTEALELSNADLQQFAYVASHDLQEPLRTVVSYLQLLTRRYKGKLDPEADEFISFAVDGAKRMSQLIQDLLSYSGVDAHGVALTRLDCEEVLNNTLANLHFLLEAMDAEVDVGFLPTVLGDASQLSCVFQNLLGNAVKYRRRDRKPVIHISAAPGEDGQWVFSVADNGIGIAPEHHDRIFKIFQRLHNQAQYPGTGIGLALVRRIITRHGGRVWVESVEGEGTTFKFTLRGA